MVATKELLATIDSESFHFVDNFVTTVVALANVTFTVLVRENRTHGFHHSLGSVVFRSDKFDAIFLAFGFLLDDVIDFRIGLLQCRFKHYSSFKVRVPNIAFLDERRGTRDERFFLKLAQSAVFLWKGDVSPWFARCYSPPPLRASNASP